ncbi:hypothetical protein O6H91_01G081000 [Diphasiastrum complanatum]|uniref:Uncharacterized protein n=2 Tax=Diphasiastrum complanatum TaxID=34168 RepID=A0ACC2EP94_DIPCM|nr:hypothetical protein O6H91_01G027700 [Diphasiastrum complanatum]KAJ7569493.1 hypothetical protein O6H91_01G081000 [Diphasiastrum complanatum]
MGEKLQLQIMRCLVLALLVNAAIQSSAAQLAVGFYANTCPNAESIITETVTQKFNQAPTSAPATLRLFFHDCMVEGCDASVIIASTPGNTAEKDAPDNLSLAGDGFDTVIRAKEAVEAKCPGIVSCADVLALATRDLVALVGGPKYPVQTGRRDGRISVASAVKLPHANNSVDQLVAIFAQKGLNQTDVVTLSGAHTIGFSHCSQFSNRIFGFSSNNGVDPTMNPGFAKSLQLACPQNVDPSVVVNFDVTTPTKFDNAYYKNLRAGEGVLTSDEVLFTDGRTKGLVTLYAKKSGTFSNAFVAAITKMGSIGVKVGNDGEIRQDCSKVN